MSQPSDTTENQLLTALDPQYSVWVSANAGAGKTWLLVARVLRLLLSGAAPGRIICITYTKAAAAEMQTRVMHTLSEWAAIPLPELEKSLVQLLGYPPTDKQCSTARTLFASVLDAPGGIRMQTLHAFCQSLLRRFPLEAGVPPHFNVLDDATTAELLYEAGIRLMLRSAGEHDPALKDAMSYFAATRGDHGIRDMLQDIIGEQRKFRLLFSAQPDTHALEHSIARMLDLKPHANAADIVGRHFNYAVREQAALREAAERLQMGKKTDTQRGEGISEWLSLSNEQRVQRFDDYFHIYYKRDMEPREAAAKSLILPEYIIDAMHREQQRVWQCRNALLSLDIATESTHALHIASGLMEIYTHLKTSRAALDYEDLVLTARTLLSRPGISAWVLYKLDGGIDHILLDEAQDTSEEQWNIVRYLTEEFYSGQTSREDIRTLFVVGDAKQSIFRFQGAEPEAFIRMQGYFSEKARDAGAQFSSVALLHSWRSVSPVLQLADEVAARTLPTRTEHIVIRKGEAGRVELWPLQLGEKLQAAEEALAATLSETIAGWIQQKRPLASRGRPVNAGDIMILVRTRGTLVGRLIKHLKRRGVPVAGADRLRLNDSLAVRDILAVCAFLLIPDDDLNLACALKSPLFGVSEEQLFELAHGRGGLSLWQRLQAMKEWNTVYGHAVDQLSAWLSRVDYLSPYSLLVDIIELSGGRRRIAGRMGYEHNEPLDELLSQALAYERTHTPSLQGFVHWLEAGNSDIKRDMDHSGGSLRIITVHGAKGLQAPIVIMPDTVHVKPFVTDMLWSEGEPEFPLRVRGKQYDVPLTAGLRGHAKTQEFMEQMRLLYVALTRAEDELYIAGYGKKDDVSPDSWYAHIRAALHEIGEPCDTPLGEGISLSSRQEKPVEPRQVPADKKEEIPLPAYMEILAPYEESPAVRLNPSHMEEDTSLAPPFARRTEMVQFGKAIHRLLQWLPSVPPEEREDMAARILRDEFAILDAKRKSRAVKEAIALITHPELAQYFTEHSLAEIPVAGTIEWKGKPVAVAGQVDRLSILDGTVSIIDYKSHLNPPAQIDSIPRAYIRQLAVYRALMSRIYPAKRLKCIIIWTARGTWHELPDDLLDAVLEQQETPLDATPEYA